MLRIETFKDYRTFVASYVLNQRKIEPLFNNVLLAKRAKLKSSNHLQMILSGKRDLTITTLHTLAKGMELLGAELDYFETMVLENQSGSKIEKNFYLKRMQDQRRILKEEKLDKSFKVNRSSLIENSDYAAISILANNLSKVEAIHSITNAINIPSKEAERMLAKMVATGGLLYNGERYSVQHRNLMVVNPIGLNLTQTKFMRDGLLENVKVFDAKYPQGAAKFLNLLFSAPAGSLVDIFEELKLKIELTRQSFSELSEEDLGVYRLQVQLYRHRSSEN